MKKTQSQKLHEIQTRLMKLSMQGAITRQREHSLLEHLRASMKYGDTELDSHLRLTDEELMKN